MSATGRIGQSDGDDAGVVGSYRQPGQPWAENAHVGDGFSGANRAGNGSSDHQVGVGDNSFGKLFRVDLSHLDIRIRNHLPRSEIAARDNYGDRIGRGIASKEENNAECGEDNGCDLTDCRRAESCAPCQFDDAIEGARAEIELGAQWIGAPRRARTC